MAALIRYRLGSTSSPIRNVEDYSNRVPEAWRQKGGVFIPMYQRGENSETRSQQGLPLPRPRTGTVPTSTATLPVKP
jgi:hypothetical protein